MRFFGWIFVLVAVALFGIAGVWSTIIIADVYPSIGSLGGQGDWIWVVLDVLERTGQIWGGGLLATLFAFCLFIGARIEVQTHTKSRKRDD